VDAKGWVQIRCGNEGQVFVAEAPELPGGMAQGPPCPYLMPIFLDLSLFLTKTPHNSQMNRKP